MSTIKKIILALTLGYGFMAQAKTTVIYFGGWGSTAEEMRAWSAASNNSDYSDDYSFIGVPYPAGVTGWKKNSALNSASGEALVEKYVKMIVRAHHRDPNSAFIIAGHSSGSPLAFEIGRRLARMKRPTPDFNVKFANLDGFNAPRTRFKSLCVAATQNVSTCTIVRHPPLSKTCRAAQVPGKLNVCYHFSILNKNVGKKTRIANGYNNISPNFTWLEQLDGASPHDSQMANEQGDRGHDGSASF